MERLTILAMLFAAPALAQPVPPVQHTIDMTTPIIDLHGKPVPDPSLATAEDPRCEKCGPITLGTVIATALLSDRKDEPNLSAVDKAKRGALAMRLLDDKAAVLTAPQVAEIERLMSIWAPLVAARALPLIDPATDISK